MKVAIVGAVNYDRIVTYNKKEVQSFGGILYNTFYLARLLDQNSVVYPVTKIGKEDISAVKELLKPFKNVDTSFITVNETGTNENLLVYTPEGERSEKLTMRIEPFCFKEIKPVIHSDMILFNFITGFTIPLAVIRKTRENSDSTIYIDVHSKVLGIRGDGTRYGEGWDDWRDWFKFADIVQMNGEECRLIFGKKSLVEVGKTISSVGPHQIIVTLREKGAFIYFVKNYSHYHRYVPTVPCRAVDTTGCGDCFTAGYIYGMFVYENPVEAVAFANKIAGKNCETLGLKLNPFKYKFKEK